MVIASIEEDEFKDSQKTAKRRRLSLRNNIRPQSLSRPYPAQTLTAEPKADTTSSAPLTSSCQLLHRCRSSENVSSPHIEKQQRLRCPICNILLDAVADTEIGQQAHVNGCIDFVPAEGAEQTDPPTRPDVAIDEWLESLGLCCYIPQFQAADVDMEALVCLSTADLQSIGVGLDHCQLIARAVKEYRAAAGPPGATAPQDLVEEGGIEEPLVCNEWGLSPNDMQDSPSWEEEGFLDQWDLKELEEEEEEVKAEDPGGGAEAEVAEEVDGEAPCARPPDELPEDIQYPIAGRLSRQPSPAVGMFTRGSVAPTKITNFFTAAQDGDLTSEGRGPRDQSKGVWRSSCMPYLEPSEPAGDQLGGRARQESRARGDQYQPERPPGPLALCGGGGSGGGNGGRPSSHPSVPAGAPPSPGSLCPSVLAPMSRAQQAAVNSSLLPRWFPIWHTIPGTNFVVDAFGPISKPLRCPSWFLTHFHADHYKGLSKKFNKGVVYGSPTTLRLAQKKLRVEGKRLHPIPLNQPVMIDQVKVTLVEANHCPGAAMILAEPQGHPPVLHTGDCRLDPSVMETNPHLQALRGRALLILDTTYCDPQYTFPPQQEVLRFALEAIQAEQFNPRTLYVFGSYTIGKERLFLEVAHTLGQKVYMSKAKMEVMACVDLAPAYRELLTNNHFETNIHVVPLGKVNIPGLEHILRQYKGRYSTIVGFQPTGWTQPKKEQKNARPGKRLQRGTTVVYQLPYSEHSSFTELQRFVQWFSPLEIIPFVGNDKGGPKAKKMVELLRQGTRTEARSQITDFLTRGST